jgi:hypothetical protein
MPTLQNDAVLGICRIISLAKLHVLHFTRRLFFEIGSLQFADGPSSDGSSPADHLQRCLKAVTMRVRALGVCLAIALAQPALARDIYVHNLAGDDRSTGEQTDNSAGSAGPVQTIGRATHLAGPGDRIVLAATNKPYHESVSLVGQRMSGSPVAPLSIIGNGAVLDGSAPIPSAAWEHFSGDVFRFRPDRLGYQQLFLDGRPALRRPVTSMAGTVPPLAPLEWSLTGGYLYFRVEPGRMPDAYEPSYAALQTGITLYHVSRVEVVDLVVQGFQLDGINVFDTATDVRILGVVARGNGRAGISVGGSSRAEIRDCLVGDNGAAQLRTEGYSQTRVVDCELLDNTAPAEVIDGGRLWIDGKAVTTSDR